MTSRYAKLSFLVLFAFLSIESSLQISPKASNRVFSINILREIVSKYQDKNVLVSPYFIQRTLTLATLGAKEPLKSEILNVIGLQDAARENPSYLSYFKLHANSFFNTSQVFYKGALTMRKKFSTAVENNFNVVPQAFTGSNAEEKAKSINTVVERNIKKFRNLISADFMRDIVSVIFLNAAFYKSLWDQPFDRECKRVAQFKARGSEMDISAIYGIKTVQFADLPSLGATAIEIPYKNSDAKLMILLPHQDIVDINWSNVSDIKDIRELMALQDVAISLPEFQVETQIRLTPILKKLGLKGLFVPGANFLNAFQQFPDDAEVEFVHAAQLDVSDYGSNVKSEESAPLRECDSSQTPKKMFFVDRPFVIILHSKDAVYLVGRIVAIDFNSSIRITVPSKPETTESDIGDLI